MRQWLGAGSVVAGIFFGIFDVGLADDRPGEVDSIAPQATTNTEITPLLLSIPPARGRILDRTGRLIADTKVAEQAMILVPEAEGEDAAIFIKAVRNAVAMLPPEAKEVTLTISDERLEAHFRQRRRMPLAITEPMDAENLNRENFLRIPQLSLRSVYVRTYPHKNAASHLLGYLGKTEEVLAGPIRQDESYWQPMEGRAGLEKTFQETLAGTPGSLLLAVKADGTLKKPDVLKPPVAGNDVVLTLDLPSQIIVEKHLADAKRPGAVVLMDTDSGDVIASASYPTFSPGDFVPGISAADFNALSTDGSAPLFNRSVSASYPPGSTFKPLVGLAGLNSGSINPYTSFDCGPELEIDGRIFRNWSEDESGMFDLHGALIRSHNSWFYQAAIITGGDPILRTARAMGFAVAPDLPLEQVASGSLPETVPSRQGLANLSIGQGTVSASPLQVAGMMASFCNGIYRPKPRLVMQSQTRRGEMLDVKPPDRVSLYTRANSDMRYVRNGLYSVVNHTRGTGTKARLSHVRVCGKTGTSQWSRKGEQSTMVWFTGFVPDSQPPIAFAVALEGEPGEKIFGGTHAAPVIGKILGEIFSGESDSFVRISPSRQELRQEQGEIASTAIPELFLQENGGTREVLRAIPVSEEEHRESFLESP